jgi:hypothetical protein
MLRRFVAVALLACACSRSDPGRGPAFTPAVADLLTAIAKDCAFTRSGGHEQRTCRGRQTTMTIDLSEGRLRAVEIVVLASSSFEAAAMLRPILPSVASPALIDAIAERMTSKTSVPDETVEGVIVHVASVNPRYTLSLTW